MECNRDEASRAKEIGERKLTEKDVAGAKRFALKAQALYPELDGLSQLLATIQVYAASEKLVNGVHDYYGILGVHPKAEENSIRKHFRRLALTLHPDKNKSVGADGAFNIISEAWSFLSDPSKRNFYDQQLNLRTYYRTVSTANRLVPAARKYDTAQSNGCTKSAAGPSTTPKVPETISLWTSCSHCRMQYEHHRKYMNRNLLCANCHKVYLAVESSLPPTKILSWASFQPAQNVANSDLLQDLPKKKKKGIPVNHSSSADVWSNGVFVPVDLSKAKVQPHGISKTDGSQAPSISTHAATPSQHPNELNTSHDEVFLNDEALGKKFQAFHREATKSFASQTSTHASSSARKRKIDEREAPVYTLLRNRKTKSDTTRDLSQRETRIMLMKKARMDTNKAVDEWKHANALRLSKKMEALAREEAEKKQEIEKGVGHGVKCGLNKPADIKSGSQMKKSSPENIPFMTMSVPDSDFHDFDKDRLEKSFGANEVWAAYDDDDGMPRLYALVQEVVSVKHFKMKISWLNTKSNAELAPIKWVDYGFVKTCGDFFIGKHKLDNHLNAFSHKVVNWRKGPRGVIQIYPTKGDVWALFKNWSPKWDLHTPDEVVHEYELVQVVEGYNEELGVTVAPLVKVAGFKTVFHEQHSDPEKSRTIGKEELFRFSHQIPCYVLTGEESPNAPKGCRELDPASTPMEFQNVITEEVKNDEVKNAEKSDDHCIFCCV